IVQYDEKFKAEDKAQRNTVSAKNVLEANVFTVKNSVQDEKLLDKCEKTMNHKLASNQMAEVEEYQNKQKELEKLCNPIISKLYQGAGPTIKEVE
uniref:Uncharacterized protein n=1 Tax=Periophthalmus magnuspinnatus TaxID=409849 RepID=A0A3B4ATA9_9GOBI